MIMNDFKDKTVTVYVSRAILADSLRLVNQFDDLTCKIIYKDIKKQEQESHPSYMLGAAELVPIIVSGLGLATGIVSLINSLVELKKAKLKNNEVQIQVKERIIIIQSNSNIEDITKDLLIGEEE